MVIIFMMGGGDRFSHVAEVIAAGRADAAKIDPNRPLCLVGGCSLFSKNKCERIDLLRVLDFKDHFILN